jgi:hypothetical protein
MRVLIIRSKWDLDSLPLDNFLARIRQQGFDGSEIHLPSLRESPETTIALHRENHLAFVMMITTEGRTPDEHLLALEQRYKQAVRYKPLHINCHTGRDVFSLEDNLRIFRHGLSLVEEYGVPLYHETHRGRATYSLLSTLAILRALPALKITADFSHWCCVHESLLGDMLEELGVAIRQTGYIHARVGHPEGPQVTDPRAPEWQNAVEAHLGWWEQIASALRGQNSAQLAICPEFGPPPYMPTLPYTQSPVADVDEIVRHMMQLLRTRLYAQTIS